jgi:predicted secreted protein
MGIGTYVAIYFIVWWTVIFAVLPFGVRSQHEDGAVEDGTEPGAPQRPLLIRKMLVTSVLAALIVGTFAWAVETGRLTLEMFPMPIKLY